MVPSEILALRLKKSHNLHYSAQTPSALAPTHAQLPKSCCSTCNICISPHYFGNSCPLSHSSSPLDAQRLCLPTLDLQAVGKFSVITPNTPWGNPGHPGETEVVGSESGKHYWSNTGKIKAKNNKVTAKSLQFCEKLFTAYVRVLEKLEEVLQRAGVTFTQGTLF